MARTQQYNEPTLRFPEFSGEWSPGHLGEFFTFKNGVNADKSAYGRGHKFINVLDIIADQPITFENIIGSVSISDKEFEKFKVVCGDILFQRSSETRREVGQSNVYLDKTNSAIFGGFVIRGHPKKELNSRFFHSLLKTRAVRKDITSRSGGSTRYNIGQEALSQTSVNVAPTLSEQQKIASFLSATNENIAQLTRKKELLEQYKKGCLQILFSQTVRFKDDNGKEFPDWEEKRLGNIVLIRKGQQLNREDMTKYGNFPVVNGGVTISGFTDKPNAQGGVVTISEGGNSCGFVAWQDVDFWLGGHCYALEVGSEKINTIFLFQELQAQQQKIMRLRVGSGLPNIQKRDLLKLQILLPHPEEQQKIANFFSAIDAKIDLTTQKLNHATAFKKGLLQQMFV